LPDGQLLRGELLDWHVPAGIPRAPAGVHARVPGRQGGKGVGGRWLARPAVPAYPLDLTPARGAVVSAHGGSAAGRTRDRYAPRALTLDVHGGDDLVRRRVDHRHVVGEAVRRVELLAVRRDGETPRVPPDGDRGD